MGVFTTRPVLMGTHGMVAAGHYLGAMAGLRMLEKGGNAFDAAAAVGFSLGVLEFHQNTIGGEVPMLIYPSKEQRVIAVSGQGPAPKAAKLDWFVSRGMGAIPGDGLTSSVVPSIVATWIEVLKHYGTMRLVDVLNSAIDLAENGFPIQGALHDDIASYEAKYLKEWPTSAKTLIPNGRVPDEGEVFKQPELARTFRTLVEAEKAASDASRVGGLEAARKEFYEGGIAESIVKFSENKFLDASGDYNSGFLGLEDLSDYRPKIEEPVTTSYRDYDVFKCGPWTQGPVFLQQLNVLEDFDLESLGHNSADYIHLLLETAKLCYDDRERYYGDPDFDSVPLNTLLSKQHASELRSKIDMHHATNVQTPSAIAPLKSRPNPSGRPGDTTHLDVVDKWGNMVAATQSGGWVHSSPLVENLGFALSTRAQIFYLDPGRNNHLQPGKRPRTTLTPSFAFKDGRPYMAFGTPGGDQQDQWTLQFFLNLAAFDMNLQEAIDAPSFHSFHFPISFFPRTADPNKVVVEGRIPKDIQENLTKRGHVVQQTEQWWNGRVSAVMQDQKTGVLKGAASAKLYNLWGNNTAYVVGW